MSKHKGSISFLTKRLFTKKQMYFWFKHKMKYILRYTQTNMIFFRNKWHLQLYSFSFFLREMQKWHTFLPKKDNNVRFIGWVGVSMTDINCTNQWLHSEYSTYRSQSYTNATYLYWQIWLPFSQEVIGKSSSQKNQDKQTDALFQTEGCE